MTTTTRVSRRALPFWQMAGRQQTGCAAHFGCRSHAEHTAADETDPIFCSPLLPSSVAPLLLLSRVSPQPTHSRPFDTHKPPTPSSFPFASCEKNRRRGSSSTRRAAGRCRTVCAPRTALMGLAARRRRRRSSESAIIPAKKGRKLGRG